MRIFISCDIEGIGCVTRPEHSSVEGRDYIQSRRLMTGEVNAAIKAAFDAGAERVLVADSHNVGLNILPEELDQRAELIMGYPRPLSMMEGVQQGFEAAFLVGYHGRPGNVNAVIAHNFHSRLMEMTINGRLLGELGLNAALAGLYGVPVVLVTGDEATAAEAEELLPWAEKAAVKKGLGNYAAQCFSPPICRALIYDAALKALGRLETMRSFKIDEPVILGLKTTTTSGANQLQRIPLLKRLGPLQLETEALDLKTALNIFLVSVDLLSLVPYI